MRPILLFVCLLMSGNLALSQANPSIARLNQRDIAKWREDLRFMAEEMPRRHRSLYHTLSPRQFRHAVDRLSKRIPSMSRHEIIVEMAKIVAMVGDGHTNIAPGRDLKIGFRTYPLKLYMFKDGVYVRAAAREHAAIVGARVVGIGNASVQRAYEAVSRLIGRDNDMGAKFFAPFLLAMPEVLHALGLIDDMEQGTYTLEQLGHQKVVTVRPLGPAELLPPDTDTSWKLKPGWLDARESASRPPLWLRDPDNKFWFEYLPDTRAVYVQCNQVGNKEHETLEDFAARLFSFVDSNRVDRFILDLRLNRGGNGALIRPLLLGIIKSSKIDQQGKLFTIIGRSTWSAAQFLVNDLERYTNTLFVGEPTGGKANSYGDSRKIILPNSGITVRVSTLWWQTDERDTRQWTAPQLAAGLTFEKYRNDVDPALEVILNYSPARPLTDLLLEASSQNAAAWPGAVYRKWKSDPLNEYVDPERALIDLGYQLMAANQVGKAIAIFTLCTEASPHSWNAYDSLGEGYLLAGDTNLAIQNYRKSLSLNPKNANAAEVLERLQENQSRK